MHGYKINRDLNLIAYKLSGRVSLQQIAEMLAETRKDPDFSSGLNVLSDTRELDSVYSYEELHEFLNGFPEPDDLPEKPRSSVLVSRDAAYGMGRVWEAIAEDRTRVDMRVHRTMDDALAWLGLPPDARVEFPF